MIKNKDFIILFLGRLITNFGDSIYLIATMLLVFSLSGSTFYTGLALFLTSSTAIVQIILSPILNRINMKKFLIVTQIIQGVLLLFIPYLHITGNLKVYHVLKDKEDIALLLQVHDELIFEVEKSSVEKYSEILADIMKNTVQLEDVKLNININIGKNWAEAK